MVGRVWLIKVEGKPIPAPRVSRQDKWKPRPRVQAYHQWRDKVALASKTSLRGVNLPFQFPVRLSFRFGLAGRKPRCDIDNLIKGVKDALVRAGVLRDDTVREVPLYGSAVVEFLCRNCPRDRDGRIRRYSDAPTCPGISNCPYEFAIIKIEEITDPNYQWGDL